jgi:hypothetical protein
MAHVIQEATAKKNLAHLLRNDEFAFVRTRFGEPEAAPTSKQGLQLELTEEGLYRVFDYYDEKGEKKRRPLQIIDINPKTLKEQLEILQIPNTLGLAHFKNVDGNLFLQGIER